MAREAQSFRQTRSLLIELAIICCEYASPERGIRRYKSMHEFTLTLAKEALDSVHADRSLERILDLISHQFDAVGAALIFTDEEFSCRDRVFVSERFRNEFSFATEIHLSGRDAEDAPLIRGLFSMPLGDVFSEKEILNRNNIPIGPSLMREVLDKYCGVSYRSGMNIGVIGGKSISLSFHFSNGTSNGLKSTERKLAQLYPILFRALQIRDRIQCTQDPFEERLSCAREIYGLTASEYAIFRLMLSGATGRVIAAQRGIAYETYRSHAKAVLIKAGCRSKAELAGRVMGVRSSPT